MAGKVSESGSHTIQILATAGVNSAQARHRWASAKAFLVN
jgi:hypothetical protein